MTKKVQKPKHDERLVARVSPELRDRVRVLAFRRGEAESSFVRRAVSALCEREEAEQAARTRT